MKQLLFLFLWMSAAVAAAQTTFTATATRDNIALNERLRVEFKMNADGDNFTPPDFRGFKVATGPVTGVSQRYINGVGSFAKTYTYILAPESTGTKTIGSATMDYQGTTYTSDPFNIQVTKAIERPREMDSQQPLPELNVHLVAEVSNASPYLNEAIRVVYKLYVSNNTGIRGWTDVETPKYEDFWSLTKDRRDEPVRDGTYKGEPYRYLVLRDAILYPQKTGRVTMEPLVMDVNVLVPSGRRSFFGRQQNVLEKLRVTAGARTLNVKDLPQDGRPASFTGAVGQFDFNVDVTRSQLEAGESLNATVVVEGTGNLQLMQLPEIEVPQSLEVFEPERIDNTDRSVNSITGSIEDNYTIVPQFGGTYEIPAVEFSYFDPKKKQYVTINSDAQEIVVTGPAVTAATPGGTNVLTASDTFAFIATSTDLEDIDGSTFFGSTAYWTILGGSFLLIPLFLLVARKRDQTAADVKGQKIKKANKLSKKYLSDASRKLDDPEAFYESLERALHNFLKAKLNIPTAEMSKERIDQLLQQRQVQEEPRKEFMELLSSAEFARYAPSSETSMQQDYDKASRVINALDKQIHRR
ncbi:BatD family protein [Nonlabens ponticola]|uniref:Protein BatD n=1 Tax=Nonlabens ponticola TaxID=2496866 RepID=A0A3S9MV64_9FLAO|nr:BatD family protein [Nonlabens ponticola]AZQ43069.1 protein BatD [Nonlabens ponticola]